MNRREQLTNTAKIKYDNKKILLHYKKQLCLCVDNLYLIWTQKLKKLLYIKTEIKRKYYETL